MIRGLPSSIGKAAHDGLVDLVAATVVQVILRNCDQVVLSINVNLETHTLGEFQFGYGWMGPTEARLVLIALNTLALFRPPLPFHVGVVGATIFDVLGALLALAMALLLLGRVVTNLRRLAALEPPRR